MKKRFLLWGLFAVVALGVGSAPVFGQVDPNETGRATLDQEVLTLNSELRAMSHGFYTEVAWTKIYNRYDELLGQAELAERDDLVMQLSASRALVLGQALGKQAQAISLLESVLQRYENTPNPLLRRLYTQLADLHASQGDEPAVARLIAQYRASNLHDPGSFTYEGEGTEERPLKILRGKEHGGDPSLTVTAMENSRKRAMLSRGRLAQDFTGTTRRGKTIDSRDYRGEVVLLDFYHPNWPGRADQLPRLLSLYEDYRKQGFEVVGIPLVPNAPTKVRLPWVLLASGKGITQPYQVFGEATTVLIDQDGRILGRNLPVQEMRRLLAEYVKQEL